MSSKIDLEAGVDRFAAVDKNRRIKLNKGKGKRLN